MPPPPGESASRPDAIQNGNTLVYLARLFMARGFIVEARSYIASAIEVFQAGCAEERLHAEASQIRGELDALLTSGYAGLSNAGYTPLGLIGSFLISTALFDYRATAEIKRRIFKHSVSRVEIETSSQCNRRCTYCPNLFIDRFSHNENIDDNLYKKIIEDLVEIGYDQEIAFVGYGEPLMHVGQTAAVIRHARQRLPRSRLVIYSNGDYLNGDVLEELIGAGLNEIIVSHHPGPTQKYSDTLMLSRFMTTAKKVGLPLVVTEFKPAHSLHGFLATNKISIKMQQINLQEYGHGRGGIFDNVGAKVENRAPCFHPIYQFVIQYSGKVIPCCTLHADAPSHADCIIDTMTPDKSIFDIYMSEKQCTWRRDLLSTELKGGVCRTCQIMDGQVFSDDLFSGIQAAARSYMSGLEADGGGDRR